MKQRTKSSRAKSDENLYRYSRVRRLKSHFTFRDENETSNAR
jgi:hypothetical protein